MQQDNQQIHPYQSEEIDLKKLFNSLLERKFFIFSLTIFITLLSFLYVNTITPIYKAQASFISSDAISIHTMQAMNLKLDSPETDNIDILKKLVFAQYLSVLSSRKFQKAVFIDGDFLTELNPNNNPIDNIDEYADNFVDSITIMPPSQDKNNLLELPYIISIEGSNAQVITSYLNELVEAANQVNISELTALSVQKLSNALDKINLERSSLLVISDKKRLDEIERLEYDARLAKSLGIEDNNFNQIANGEVSSNLSISLDASQDIPVISLDASQDLPVWYLYGEKALNERIKILKALNSDKLFFINEIIELDLQKLILEKRLSMILDSLSFSTMELTHSAITPSSPIKPNLKLTLLLSLIISLVMSTLLALVINAVKSD